MRLELHIPSGISAQGSRILGIIRAGIISVILLFHLASCESKKGAFSITFDTFGGIENIKGHNTSGFFRTELIGNRWWLNTPLNNAFLSLGVDHVSFYADYAPLLGYSPFYHNNMARFGGDGESERIAWAEEVRSRFLLLGFNTLGAWSDFAYFRSTLPYTINLNFTPEVVKNFGDNNVPTVSKGWWIGFPDVFDIRFEENCKEVARKKILDALVNDPYLIGYFTDNELNWFGGNQFWYNPVHTLADDFISAPASYAGKQYWVNEFLQKKKGYTLESLNSAYGTNFSSWDDVLAVQQIPNSPSYPAIEIDKEDFLYEIGEQYFRVTNEAIKSRDPNHLNLCARFASDAPNEILVKAGRYCDVVSVNDYYALDNEISNQLLGDPQERWRRFYALTKQESDGRPFIQTEFGIRARDSGLPNSWGAGWWVDFQEERGQFYKDDLDRLLWLKSDDEYFLVGFHWFEWADEPATGRFDGENSNYGINNIKNEPYLTFYKALSNYNEEVYLRLLNYKYKKLQKPELLYPEDGQVFTTGSENITQIFPDRFSWTAPGEAESHTLIISPFRNFADDVSIKLKVNESSTNPELLLARGKWFWSVSADSEKDIDSEYADPRNFIVGENRNFCGDFNNVQNFVNYVEFRIPDDSDGSAVAFSEEYYILAVFTVNSLGKNNPINGGGGGRVSLRALDCRKSPPVVQSITFEVMPAVVVDSRGEFGTSTRYIRVYGIYDTDQIAFDQAIDPQGSFIPGQWSPVSIYFEKGRIKEIGFYVEIGTPFVPLDQRIVMYINDIVLK